MTSLSDNDLMRDCCALATKYEIAWRSFRSLPWFLYAMENFSEEAAQEAIKAVPHTDLKPELFAADIGQPPKVALPDGRLISPSMLRYSAIARHMGTKFQMHHANIIEIGCGFGGQCRVIRHQYERGAYLCVDVEPVAAVASKYLAYFSETQDAGVLTAFDFQRGVPPSFLVGMDAICISNYAFSEMTEEVQERYFNQVLRKCPRGFFIWNSPKKNFPSWDLEEFRKRLSAIGRRVQVEDEPVKTGQEIKAVWWR